MEDIVRVLARHTGAEFYIIGTWTNERGEPSFYEYVFVNDVIGTLKYIGIQCDLTAKRNAVGQL